MKKDAKFYWKLFISTFYLSAFTFGGGFVIVPLMRKKFVEQLGWLEEKEMMDITAIAQSSPGAIAVNASILLGYRLAGFFGSFITIVATILPPLITLSIVSVFYTFVRDNVVVNAVLTAIRAGVAAIIVDVVFKLAKEGLDEKSIIAVILMIGSFIANFFFDINLMLIIITCGCIGYLYSRIKRNSEKEKKEENK